MADDVVTFRHSLSYVRAARDAGGVAALTEVPGDHDVVIDPSTDAWRRTLEILEDL